MATAAIGAAVGIAGAVWGAHTARLTDAKNETSAVVAAVPAFDADIQVIVSAYNAGQCSQAEAIAAFGSMDHSLYSYLHSLVGKPGTSWQDNAPAGKCDKACTAGCCVYYSVLHPSLVNLSAAMQAGSGTVTIGKVYPGKYSPFSREQYSVSIVKPNVVQGTEGTLTSILHSLTGDPASPVSQIINGGAASQAAGNSNLLLIVIVLFFGFAVLLMTGRRG